MKIAFHGAARCVTGTKHLLTLKNGKRVLLDCGMFQGMGKETDALNRHFGFDPAAVDYLVLSHAHIDHSGLIPKLVKDGFRGKIFCTPATKELAYILMEDSAQIQKDDAKHMNKRLAAKSLPLIEPLYDHDDVEAAIRLFDTVEYGNTIKIDDDVEVLFTDAGHIIGSAAVHLRLRENDRLTRLTFSGDVGRYRDIILRSPDNFPQADIILLESTYGNSLHDEHISSPDILFDWIQKTCLQKKGKLIIPAFSVGRTQEILYALNELEESGRWKDVKVPVFVDSPLSVEATEVVKSFPQYFNKKIQKVLQTDADPFKFHGLKYIKTSDESKALNDRHEPMIIISASGMADAGRIKHHIANNIGNARNTILLVGYCEPNSLGGRLMNGAKEVRIFGEYHTVKAEVGQMRSMSAHGDYEDLSQFLACQDKQAVRKLFLVHGEYEVQQGFRDRLVRKGFADVEIPAMHQEIGLG
jgi:metallo-beta-lactamase family protein